MVIRPETPADTAAVRDVNFAAFETRAEAPCGDGDAAGVKPPRHSMDVGGATADTRRSTAAANVKYEKLGAGDSCLIDNSR